MVAYSFLNNQSSYAAAWREMIIKPDILPQANTVADKIISFKDRYMPLEIATNVPWYFIGLVHMRESNCDFDTHLHNGDPLFERGHFRRTIHEPVKRPIADPQNGVTYTFEESALDALHYEFGTVSEWSIEQIAYFLEKYNGFGYRMRGIASPYLWAGSNQYVKGKFVEDGAAHWRPEVVDKQLGAMVVLKCILDKTQPLPDIASEGIYEVKTKTPISPSADIPKPKSAQLRKVSRKFWLTEWTQSFLTWATGGTVGATVLDIGNIQATRTYVDTVKSFAVSNGVYIVIGALIAAFIVTTFLKRWMKEDVQEGRNIPSGEAQ